MDMAQLTKLLFEMSTKGRRCHLRPVSDSPSATNELDGRFLREVPTPLPELAELDLMRHYT